MTAGVYLVLSDNGLVKIGHASDIQRRLRALRAASPCQLEVVYIIETARPREVEGHLHTLYAHCRQRGEWFSLTQDDIDTIRAMGDPVVVAPPPPPRAQRISTKGRVYDSGMAIPSLERLRLDAVLSQRDLARQAGISQQTVVSAEKGERVYPVTVRKLAKALGVQPRELAPFPAEAEPRRPSALAQPKQSSAVLRANARAQAEQARARGDEDGAARFERIASVW